MRKQKIVRKVEYINELSGQLFLRIEMMVGNPNIEKWNLKKISWLNTIFESIGSTKNRSPLTCCTGYDKVREHGSNAPRQRAVL